MKNRRKMLLCVLGLFGFFIFNMIGSGNASAIRIDTSSITKKWVFTQYYNCLKYGGNDDNPNSNPSGFHKIIESQTGNNLVSDSVMSVPVGDIGNWVYMPSHNFDNTLDDRPINCKTLFAGGSNSTAVLDLYNNGASKRVRWTSPRDAKAFLQTIGYTFEGDGVFEFNLSPHVACIEGLCWSDNSRLPSRTITATKQADGIYKYDIPDPLLFNPNAAIYGVELRGEVGRQELRAYVYGMFNGDGKVNFFDTADGYVPLDPVDPVRGFNEIATSFNGRTVDVQYGYINIFGEDIALNIAAWKGLLTINTDFVNSAEAGTYTFGGENGNNYTTRRQSVNALSGYNYLDKLALNNTEKYNLYLYYLNKYVPEFATDGWTCDAENATGTHVAIKNIKDTDGDFKECYANFNVSSGNVDNFLSTTKVYTIYKKGDIHSRYTEVNLISLAEIIAWFENVNPRSLGDVWDIGSIGNVAETIDSEECKNADLGGQGWILCPVLDNSTRTVDLFESLIREWMVFDSSYLDTNSDSGDGAYTAWEIFRNMANVIMILVLLAVIFSQLTGFGIDNYGIKKILPRLIAIAILINLSYIMCGVLIDLSNLIGIGMDNMLASIGESISHGGGFGELAASATAGTGALVGTAGVIVGAVLSGAAAGGMVGMIVALILVLVMALIAILMFFVTLGARLVIILMFTVISPIAFACYVLPNTQKFFKKWWSIFSTALVVFPICGTVYGLSFVIKAIVFNIAGTDLSGMNFWMAVVAVLTPFLPFLMIPTMLKGVLKGLGVLGATIGMLGAGLSKGADSLAKGIKSTDRYQNAAKESKSNMRIRAMERFNTKNEDAIAKGTLSGAKADKYRRLNLYGNAALDQKEREYGVAFAHQSLEANQQALQEGINTNDSAMQAAAYKALMNQNGSKEATKIINDNWDKIDSRMWQTMSMTPGSDHLAGYAKYKMSGGKAGYNDWADGKAMTRDEVINSEEMKRRYDQVGGSMGTGMSLEKFADDQIDRVVRDKGYIVDDDKVKHGSLAKYEASKGTRGMLGYSDDEMKEVKNHWSSLSAGRETEFMQTILNTALHASSPKTQLAANDVISDMLAKGHLSALSSSATANNLGAMSDSLAASIKKGVQEGLNSGSINISGVSSVTDAIQHALKPQIDQAQSDKQAMSNMSESVKQLLGLK